ncbi:MAG: putative nucleic acid-binding protein contains domain [Rhodoferax sp.]|nr:putative nucleic acid-binding protein contains domain [Rhodoferax sp.]
MITADSSIWIDYFKGAPTAQTEALDAVLNDSSHELVLLDVVLMEVLRGFRLPHELRLVREALAALPVVTAGGEAVALLAADIYRTLRQKGLTVRSPIDLLVGAWCIENDCDLIQNDRDYDGMVAFMGLRGGS